MKKSLKIILSIGLALMIFTAFSFVFAEGNTIDNPLTGVNNLTDLLKRVADYIQYIALALAVPFIVWGGITILVSGGNPAEVQKGRSILLYTVIGIVVTLLATWGLDVIQQLFDITPTN
ncbi:MAG: hypothetical protein WC303_00350 [Candidatus Paceibacterota bacterium]|jgi:hypothetical protein